MTPAGGRGYTGPSQTLTGAFLNDRTLSGTLADTVNGVPHQTSLTFRRVAVDPL